MLLKTTQESPSERGFARDNGLVQKVVGHLRNRFGGKVRSFRISVRDDGLILRGEVNSHYGKQMVQEVVMQFSSLSILSNDIEVQPVMFAADDR